MNKEQFLSRKTPPKPVTLPDGSTVHIRKLSQADMEHIRKTYNTPERAAEGSRYAVNKCLVDENGSRIFEDKDLASLADSEFDDIETIATAIVDLSGVNRDRDPKKQ